MAEVIQGIFTREQLVQLLLRVFPGESRERAEHTINTLAEMYPEDYSKLK